MKLLRRCFVYAIVFSTVVALIVGLTFNGALAMTAWPGLLIVNAVCARFQFYASDPGTLLPMLVVGFLINIAIYAALFFVVITLWRTLALRSNGQRPLL